MSKDILGKLKQSEHKDGDNKWNQKPKGLFHNNKNTIHNEDKLRAFMCNIIRYWHISTKSSSSKKYFIEVQQASEYLTNTQSFIDTICNIINK